MQLRELAKAGARNARQSAANGKPQWYMTNARNSVVRELMEHYRRERKIPAGFPMTDAQRLDFELSLMNDETRERVREILWADKPEKE
jgi:hypothetical protein